MQRVLAGTLVVLALLAPGCAEPFRMHVDPAVLTKRLDWQETTRPPEREGWAGPNSVETMYRFDPPGTTAPYPGEFQLIALRRAGGYERGELLATARRIIEETAQENITLEPEETLGERTLANGLHTAFVVRVGKIVRPDQTGLFPTGVKVRILAEVGFDGRSGTALFAIGKVQVDVSQTCPPLLPCTSARPDDRTWRNVAGDPTGSILGAKDPDGLLYHVVTHA